MMNNAARLLRELHRAGDFIPSRIGTLGVGYDLVARHPNGDVVLHCGGNAGWLDWFTPVAAGESADFEVVITGRAYRLVRSVDALPAGFEPIIPDLHKRGRPAHAGTGPRLVAPPKPAPPQHDFDARERPYDVDAFIDNLWTPVAYSRSEWGAQSIARDLVKQHAVRHRVRRGTLVLWASEEL